MKTLVLFFYCVAPANVDLTIRTNKIATAIMSPQSLTILEVRSGHLPHLARPVREYPGKHVAQRIPVWPSEQAPIGFQVGSTHPRQTSGLGHLMKLDEVFELLQ
jgi:hypothetical protein